MDLPNVALYLGIDEQDVTPELKNGLVRLAKASVQNSSAVNACVKLAEMAPEVAVNMAKDLPCPEEPVTDYITDVDTRLELLNKLRSILTEVGSENNIDALVAGLFLTAPIDTLQQLLRYPANITDLAIVGGRVRAVEGLGLFLSHSGQRRSAHIPGTTFIPATATRKRHRNQIGSSPLAPASDGPSSAKKAKIEHLASSESVPSSASCASSRSQTAVKVAKTRDSSRCCILKTSHPEAAHIFPFAGSKDPTRRDILINTLKLFWPEQSSKWKETICNPALTESARNLICLNRQLSCWWSRGLFALKPLRVSADGCALDVQFHWLRPIRYNHNEESQDLASNEAFVADVRRSHWGESVVNRHSGLPLLTGHVFTFRSQVSDELPDFGLLEVQWHLLRAVAMAGGAEYVLLAADKHQRHKEHLLRRMEAFRRGDEVFSESEDFDNSVEIDEENHYGFVGLDSRNVDRTENTERLEQWLDTAPTHPTDDGGTGH